MAARSRFSILLLSRDTDLLDRRGRDALRDRDRERRECLRRTHTFLTSSLIRMSLLRLLLRRLLLLLRLLECLDLDRERVLRDFFFFDFFFLAISKAFFS